MKRIRKEKFRKRILLYVLLILLFFLGNAYSILKQELTLSGTVTIPAQTIISTPLEAKVRVESWGFLGNRLYLTITNNTGEYISGWTAIISTPNITTLQDVITATDINAYCTLDTTNQTITVVMPEDAQYGKIENGKSIELLIGEKGASSATIIDCYSQKNSINTKANVVNMQKQNFESVETYDVQVSKLEDVNYANSDLSIDIEFKEEKESEKYNTIAVVKVTNKTNKKINNLIFNLDYKDTNNYFNEINTNSLNQTLSHTKGSSYKLLDYDFIEANSYKIYQISGFVSDERFSGFSISNVEYDFEKSVTDKKDNRIENILNQNIVRNETEISTNIIANTLE